MDRTVRKQMKRRTETDWQEEIDRVMIYSMGLGKESEMDEDTVADLGIFFVSVVISIRFGALPEKVTYYSYTTQGCLEYFTHTRARGNEARKDLCALCGTQTFLIRAIPKGLLSSPIGDKNANP